ncbi:MAG: hypothetical protein NVS2B7_02250 [Herpetosiphon sp.]
MLDSLDRQASVFVIYAASVASDTPALAAQAQNIALRFSTAPDVEVRLFATNGSPLLPYSRLGPFPSLPARPFFTNSLVLPPVGHDTTRRYVVRPIVVGGSSIGVVELSQSVAGERRLLTALVVALAIAAAVAAAGALGLAHLLSRSLIRPLYDLESVAASIAQGDLAVRSKDHSEDEIGHLATEINKMAGDLQARIEQVETLAATRQQFYRSVSHELRTPLTAIRGMAENLEEVVNVSRRPELAVILGETKRLQRLVEELLQPGQHSLPPVRQRVPFALQPIIQESLALMRPRAERSAIILFSSLHTTATIVGDRDRIKQALLNLLDNALKWTPPGGIVQVQDYEHDHTVTVTIRDSGPGIPEELGGQLWERGVHGKDGGQGLGLALVKDVITAHGGTVTLLAEAGTAISLSLPVVTEKMQSD